MIACLEDLETPWPHTANILTKFRGYRVNRAGVPTFLYNIGPLEITDRIAAIEEHSLRRTITIRSGTAVPESNVSKPANPIWLRIASNLPPTDIAAFTSSDSNAARHTVKTSDGLSVSLLHPGDANTSECGRLRAIGDSTEWILPVSATQEMLLEIEYLW